MLDKVRDSQEMKAIKTAYPTASTNITGRKERIKATERLA